jgi:ankyrin repeat protein
MAFIINLLKREICEVLLSHDANSLFLQNDELDTPLHCAAMKGHASVALLLVKAAEKQHDLGERRWIDKQNKRQKTPLIEAASNGFPQVVKILLEHGADPTVQASGGKDYASYNPFSGLDFTTLHAAIAFQEWECVEILIAHCAATMSASELSRWLDITDRKGRSALALAAEANASEYVDLLVKNGATLSASSSLLEPDNQALYGISEPYPVERAWEVLDKALGEGPRPTRDHLWPRGKNALGHRGLGGPRQAS